MSEEKTDTGPSGPGKIIQLDEAQLRAHLDKQIVECVEETLNKLLDAEADRICGASRYEHSPGRLDTRAGHYERQLHTKAGEVTLRVPKLRKLPFETQIIERYRRKESSVEEALIEMYLAGVSVRRVEDITEALWGTRVSASTVSELNQKIYTQIEQWRARPIEGEYPYVYLDGLWLKRSWGGEVANVSILVAIGVDAAGFRHILGACEGTKEDKASWQAFMRSLKERGLEGVRVERLVAQPLPHRTGRARLTHPVPRLRRFAAQLFVAVSLTRLARLRVPETVAQPRFSFRDQPSLLTGSPRFGYPAFIRYYAGPKTSCPLPAGSFLLPRGSHALPSCFAPAGAKGAPHGPGALFNRCTQSRSSYVAEARISQLPVKPRCRFALLFDPGRTHRARPSSAQQAGPPLLQRRRLHRYKPFEAQSHGFTARCLRFVPPFLVDDARLASGGRINPFRTGLATRRAS